MSYEDCLEKVKTKIAELTEKKIKESLEEHSFPDMFQCWIQMDSDHEFGFLFVKTFKEFFGSNIYKKDETIIRQHGKQMGHLLQAMLDSDINQKTMINLAKSFVLDQVGDFGNWCDDVCIRMECESDEDEPV
jgi:hypothetical protein